MSQTRPNLVLGLDGGGTRTTCGLARCGQDGANVLLHEVESGPSNPQVTGIDEAVRQILRAIEECLRIASVEIGDVSAVCLALAGVGRDSDRTAVRTRVSTAISPSRILITHDADPIIAAGTDSNSGIALIAGTGSFAFARTPAGQTCRAGGLGPLLGDEGSGYWIARSALSLAARELDGRLDSTGFAGLFLDQLDIVPEDLLPTVYSRFQSRHVLAGIAPVVIELAKDGQPTAAALIDRAAAELSRLVEHLVSSLAWPEGGPEVALSGGLFANSDWFRDRVTREIRESGAISRDPRLVTSPVLGAIRLAAERCTEH